MKGVFQYARPHTTHPQRNLPEQTGAESHPAQNAPAGDAQLRRIRPEDAHRRVYIIKVDYTEQKKLAAAVSRISTNINLVCRRINSTGHFYDADVAELKERMADVWELLKVQQRNEL